MNERQVDEMSVIARVLFVVFVTSDRRVHERASGGRDVGDRASVVFL